MLLGLWRSPSSAFPLPDEETGLEDYGVLSKATQVSQVELKSDSSSDTNTDRLQTLLQNSFILIFY